MFSPMTKRKGKRKFPTRLLSVQKYLRIQLPKLYDWMAEEKDKQIIKIFEEAVKELLEFHYNNNFPFYKEVEAQAWLYMKVYERLERKGLLFHKCDKCKEFSKGRLIIRLLPEYPKKGANADETKREYSDFAITPSSFCPYTDGTDMEKQEWQKASKYDYLIMVEIKSRNNYSEGNDIKKLSTSIAQNKYFILLGDEYNKKKGAEAPEILKKINAPKAVYALNEKFAISHKDCDIYYGLIYSKKGFTYKGPFEWTEKGKLHILTNKGLIQD